ncbi:D-alanyl-D-alanine carboxypeptidase family protein [Peribacillus sp. FSL H8-0477]|uniref:D-alanyl-D-alanine carboxypeptidase family protein n=1 Tax=Peribacillus sp. FSL H8-0477 TaxID=2921388 RepID=UPI004046BCA5
MRFLNRVLPLLLICLLCTGVLPEKVNGEPVVSAKSAILMDQDSGRVIFEQNIHEISRIASITKIMTALLAIESGKMNKTVKISDDAVGTEGSSLFLKHGEKMKLEDLVYGLMLRSGNDAAAAIAEEVGGSPEGFVFLMNKKAEEIGMTNSHFTNPHGLDNTKDHFSTAYDMALLTRYAMHNNEYKKIAGTKVHRAPNSMENWDYKWTNKNRLLTSLYKYSTGGKTGYTKLAKRTLVSTATKDNMNLIAVTLNGPDDWNDHINMFESTFTSYHQEEILSAGEVKKVRIKQYKNNLYLKTKFVYPLMKDEEDKVKIDYLLLKPHWKDERDIPEVVGKAVIFLDGKEIGRRTVFYGKPKEVMSSTSLGAVWKEMFLSVLGINNG